LLLFCDVGRISVNGAVVQDLLEAADMLQLRYVVDACCSFLMQQLHESNCIGLFISYISTIFYNKDVKTRLFSQPVAGVSIPVVNLLSVVDTRVGSGRQSLLL